MRRSCRPIAAFRRRASSIASRLPLARAASREHQQVERLALLRDVAARERERALRIALDDESEHRLLAAVEDARLGPLVGERDALAHLGDIALRRRGAWRAFRRSRGAARTVSVRVSSFSTRERLRRSALRDQEIGIGDRRVACRGRDLQRRAIRGIGGGGATVALLELGERWS